MHTIVVRLPAQWNNILLHSRRVARLRVAVTLPLNCVSSVYLSFVATSAVVLFSRPRAFEIVFVCIIYNCGRENRSPPYLPPSCSCSSQHLSAPYTLYIIILLTMYLWVYDDNIEFYGIIIVIFTTCWQ